MKSIAQNVNMEMVASEETCSVYKVSSPNGDMMMTVYSIIDGITVSYNDAHLHEFYSTFSTDKNLLCIDHCNEGRMEQQIDLNNIMYTAAGDVRIENRKNHSGNMYLPLAHYHGISIIIEVEKAQKVINDLFPDFPVTIQRLKDKFINVNPMVIYREDKKLNQMFSVMYEIPKDIRVYSLKFKVLDLLLYLHTLEPRNNVRQREYFNKSQIDIIKQIYILMTSNLQTHYTLKELSTNYNISLTAMKNCFKEVYGSPIATFMRKYRMNESANLLSTTEMSINKISNLMGYESPSKFSIAFKKVMGISPNDYRSRKEWFNETN